MCSLSLSQIFTTINIVTGKSGRRDLPSHSSVPTTEGVDDADRRVRAGEGRDGDDVTDDQRQALHRRQAGPSRHQRLRDWLHRRQTAVATGQTEDRILPRQRRLITNPEPDDRRQRDVDVRGARWPDDAVVVGDELTARTFTFARVGPRSTVVVESPSVRRPQQRTARTWRSSQPSPPSVTPVDLVNVSAAVASQNGLWMRHVARDVQMKC